MDKLDKTKYASLPEWVTHKPDTAPDKPAPIIYGDDAIQQSDRRHAQRNVGRDPELAKLELEYGRAEAIRDMAREGTKTEELKLKQEEKRLQRDLIKRGKLLDEPGGPRQLVGRLLGGVQMRAIEWLWPGWIPKGYITLLAGETGGGKSTVLADITARVTTGSPLPGPDSMRREPGRVLWLGSEDSAEEMTVPRLVACGANLDNVVEIQGVIQQGKRSTFSMQDDLDSVNQWLRFARDEGRPFEMLVIDPVTSYLPGQKLRKVDLNDAGQLRTVLEPWLKLANEHNIAIVCVTHFAKDTTRAMLHRVLGSAVFAQTCRSLIAVIDRPGEDAGPYEKALVQVKVNLPEHPGGAWKFSTVKVQVGTDQRNGKPIHATRPNWEELDSALTPKSMMGHARGPVSKYEATFGIWVAAQFANMPSGEWQQVNIIRMRALADRAATERWWDDHSGRYLEKYNQNGVWWCRPKAAS